MKVIALQDGTIGKGRAVRRVRAGEQFDVPEGAKAKWFKPVEAQTEAKPEGKKGAQKAPAKAADDLV